MLEIGLIVVSVLLCGLLLWRSPGCGLCRPAGSPPGAGEEQTGRRPDRSPAAEPSVRPGRGRW